MKPKPIVTKKQIKRMKDWLQSPQGIKALKGIKGESEHDRILRKSNETIWWHKIKDVPFTI